MYGIKELLIERNIEVNNFPLDILYKVGMKNVTDNIEFYFDKSYTCESVIKELFILGIIDYIEKNKFAYLKKYDGGGNVVKTHDPKKPKHSTLNLKP